MNDILVTTTVKLPPDLLAALDRAAKAEDRSRASFVRRVLAAALPISRVPLPPPAAADAAAGRNDGSARPTGGGTFHVEGHPR